MFHVCFHCFNKNPKCQLCAGNWKTSPSDLMKAMGNHVASTALVVGDPSSFQNRQFDRGWDLESKVVVGQALLEYELDWQNKVVKSPVTGNMVKVGSLDPEDQEKFRPKGEPKPGEEPSGEKIKHKVVAGGVVVNKQIDPAAFKEKTKNMKPASSLNVKRWNSKFDIYTDDKGNNHLFMSTFDQGEFDSGAMNPERANTVRHVGVFKTPMDAKKYVMGGDEKLDLDQKKRTTLAKQTPWSPKEMGI